MFFFSLYEKSAIQFFPDCSVVITGGSAALYLMIIDILSRIFETLGFILGTPQACFLCLFPIFFSKTNFPLLYCD